MGGRRVEASRPATRLQRRNSASTAHRLAAASRSTSPAPEIDWDSALAELEASAAASQYAAAAAATGASLACTELNGPMDGDLTWLNPSIAALAAAGKASSAQRDADPLNWYAEVWPPYSKRNHA